MKTPFYSAVFLVGTLLFPINHGGQYALEELWVLQPDSAPYLSSSGHWQRGMAYNRVTGHLLVVNRLNDFSVHVLDAADGQELGLLDVSAITGGGNSSFVLNLIGVADDGAIYAANLSNSTTAPHVNIYRWESESAPQTLVFSGDPGDGNIQRWGDTFDVRGGGTITQILMGTRGNIAAVFNIDNGPTLVPSVINLEVLPGSIGYGVSFGSGNTFWGTAGASTGGPLHYIAFDQIPANTLQSFSSPIVPGGLTIFEIDPVRNLLAGLVFGTPDTVQLFDISNPNSAPVLMDTKVFPSDNANGVFAGSVQTSGDRVFVLNNNNGIAAYELKSVAETAPEIIVEPENRSVPSGSSATFSIAVKGATPMAFEWYHNNNLLPGVTTSTLIISSVEQSNTGTYKVIVSNAQGSDTSVDATLSLSDPPPESALIPLWNIPAGSRPYISNTGSSQRGMAYNHVTDHVLVPNRAGGLSIPILNGETGEEAGSMDTTGISGGSVALTQMAVADDGVIYGCNLVTAARLNEFGIYRWSSEQEAPTLAFTDISGIAPQRWGDVMDVRGVGNSTQILLGAGTGNGAGDGTTVALLTAENGIDFIATELISNAPAFAFAQGISFGEDNTFWGTSLDGELYHMSFDPVAGTATVIHNYGDLIPLTMTALDVMPLVKGGDIVVPGSFFVGGISVAAPDQFLLFEVNTVEKSAIKTGEIDFPTDVANSTATGAVEFGRDKVMAYDTNNGLMMFRMRDLQNPEIALRIGRSGSDVVISWAGVGVLQSTSDVTNTAGWSQFPGTPVNNGGEYSMTIEATGTAQFFRLSR